MKAREALNKIKTILGRDLYPTAVPKVLGVLERLESDNYRAGFAAGNRGRQAPSEVKECSRD